MLVSSSPYKKGKPDALAVLESPKRARINKSFQGTLPVLQEGDEIALPVLPMEDRKEVCEIAHNEKNPSGLDASFSVGDEPSVSQSDVFALENAKNESNGIEKVARETNEEREKESVRMGEFEVVCDVKKQEKGNEKEDGRVEENGIENENENENVNVDLNENITKMKNEIENENESHIDNGDVKDNEKDNESDISLDISSPNADHIPPMKESSIPNPIQNPNPNPNPNPIQNSNEDLNSNLNPNPNPNPNPSDIQQILAHFRLIIADLDQNPTDPREIQEIQLEIQRLQGISIDPLNTQLIQEVSDLFKAFSSFFAWFSAAETNRTVWIPFLFFCIQFIQAVLIENQSIKLCSFSSCSHS